MSTEYIKIYKNDKADLQYYFIYFPLDQEDDGGSLQIVTTANLVVGDILNFQKEDEGEKIFEQFKTKEFLIKKRVFISDPYDENVGGVFSLYVEPKR
ncbi:MULTISPECIES: hypothetical protein [Elizabethkingia]|uniref:Uncharacterized protein n=2 Tax=Elizabethkingia anophelis TaxID=1117645 RepID=A0A455ZG27_9FLAO|nr:hypothetical protein [Elizabethkingia anophelis]AIL44425.1 hypothetical protein BD94_0650 [Elizabethkingia anophelis NUHP1]DAC75797.1 TPA_exp: hypothetical protein [Elizabethkingia anophelis]